jgi:hypothetical protein
MRLGPTLSHERSTEPRRWSEMSNLYLLLGGMYLLGGTQLGLTLLAGRWLLTGRRPRFMTVTRFAAYTQAATTPCLTLLMIEITRNLTHTVSHPLPPWIAGMEFLTAIAVATGAMYVADRRGRARRTVQR